MTDDRIYRELGEISAKLTALDKKLDDNLGGVTKRLDDHEQRLRHVEKVSLRNGFIAGGIVSVGIAFLKHKLGW